MEQPIDLKSLAIPRATFRLLSHAQAHYLNCVPVSSNQSSAVIAMLRTTDIRRGEILKFVTRKKEIVLIPATEDSLRWALSVYYKNPIFPEAYHEYCRICAQNREFKRSLHQLVLLAEECILAGGTSVKILRSPPNVVIVKGRRVLFETAFMASISVSNLKMELNTSSLLVKTVRPGISLTLPFFGDFIYKVGVARAKQGVLLSISRVR